jgi:hypothetical protein
MVSVYFNLGAVPPTAGPGYIGKINPDGTGSGSTSFSHFWNTLVASLVIYTFM